MSNPIEMLLDHHFATTDSWMRSQFVGLEDDIVDFDINPDCSVDIYTQEIITNEKMLYDDSDQDSENEIEFEFDLHDAYDVTIKKDIGYNHIDHGSNYYVIDYGVMI